MGTTRAPVKSWCFCQGLAGQGWGTAPDMVYAGATLLACRGPVSILLIRRRLVLDL